VTAAARLRRPQWRRQQRKWHVLHAYSYTICRAALLLLLNAFLICDMLYNCALIFCLPPPAICLCCCCCTLPPLAPSLAPPASSCSCCSASSPLLIFICLLPPSCCHTSPAALSSHLCTHLISLLQHVLYSCFYQPLCILSHCSTRKAAATALWRQRWRSLPATTPPLSPPHSHLLPDEPV